MAQIDALLVALKQRGGSDLHLAATQEPRLRVGGALEPFEDSSWMAGHLVESLLAEIAGQGLWGQYQKTNNLDFTYELKGVARFRAHYFRDHGGMAATFRIIPSQITPLEELGLPPCVATFAHLSKGLVLVTGPTSSETSKTLASLLDKINATYQKHILSIEDPIEFIHEPKKSVVTQREIGSHTASVAAALGVATRLDPDVIMVSAMVDAQTLPLLFAAAEMGILVFAALPTHSVSKTLEHILSAFPSEQRHQVRAWLAATLAGVVSQALMRRIDGKGSVTVTEVLVQTCELPNLLREGDLSQITAMIQNGKKSGMQSMDNGLMNCLKAGIISAEDAYRKATDKSRFESLLK